MVEDRSVWMPARLVVEGSPEGENPFGRRTVAERAQLVASIDARDLRATDEIEYRDRATGEETRWKVTGGPFVPVTTGRFRSVLVDVQRVLEPAAGGMLP